MKSNLLILAAAALLLNACYPDGADTPDDYGVVATHRDPSFDFAKVKTYVLVDSVVQLGRNGQAPPAVPLSPRLNAFILKEVAAQLDNQGYEALTHPAAGQQPDVMVQVSAVIRQHIAGYYNDYWWDYWGWYPGWGDYYPYIGDGWYPYGTVGNYSYRTGTLLIEMFNPGGADPSARQVPRVWFAGIEGILTGSPSGLEDRLGANIRKAFRQSPYLKAASR